MNKSFSLNFGIRIEVKDGSGRIGSQLKDYIGRTSADALESFLLALAIEGVDLDDVPIRLALSHTIEAIANYME